MWPDNETTKDLLGFRVHADLIRSVITNPRILPVTIGVFGDWGGGKTSIMKMLEQDLDPEKWPEGSQDRADCEGIAVVYVNTWQFEGYDDAKAAMLSSVLLELAEHKRFGPKVRDKAFSLLKSVNWMRLSRLAMKHVALPAAAAYLTGGLAAIPAAVAVSTGVGQLFTGKESNENVDPKAEKKEIELGDLLKTDGSPDEPLDIRTFRSRFRKMLDDGGIKTLVVLVDDLDRCTPERIIENLEAVKLFLSVEQTAFVVGADRRIVEHAIRARYAERALDAASDEETARLVKDYLEKLVQIPYSLPRLSITEIETYMALLFCLRHYQDDEFGKCLTACDESRANNRYASFGYAAVQQALPVEPELREALTLVASSAPLIADGLKGNPRQVKRFLNALLLRKELARVAKLENVRDDVLVKLMILEYVHPELFLELFNLQAQENGYPKQLALLEAELTGPEGDVDNEEAAKKIAPKWATSSIRKWIAMEPALKDVDLRDYFWVARDRLQTTFAGISMVAPVVRQVLDGLLSGSPPKRNAAMETGKTLSEDERVSLLGLVEQRIVRHLSEKAGFDALRALIEAGMIGSAELLKKVLLTNPLDAVPAAVGMDVMTLYDAKPDLHKLLDPAISHLQKSQTVVGRASNRATTPAKGRKT